MPIEITRKELQEVIVEFKKKAFAGGGKYVDTFYGTKRFDDQKDLWHFSDEYDGDAYFAGEERLSVILTREVDTGTGTLKIGQYTGIWHMVYHARLLNDVVSKEAIFDFLKKPLQVMPVDLPFRGPVGAFIHKDFPGFEYQNNLLIGNDISYATGMEDILFHEKKVYEGFWSGGLLMKNLGDILLI